MSNEEIVKKIKYGINPDTNLELLYSQNIGVINQIVKRFGYVYRVDNSYNSVAVIEYQDLMNVAYFGLAEAVQRYDDTAGVKFITYAAIWIRQAVQRYIDNHEFTVRIPAHLKYQILKYKGYVLDYEKQNGRQPTDNGICISLGFSISELEAIRKAGYHKIMSIDAPLPDEDDITVGDSIPDLSVDVEGKVISTIIDSKLQEELWDIVKENVTDKEFFVLVYKYEKGMSLAEAGRQLGISRVRAGQLEASALRKLGKPENRKLLSEKFGIE